MREEATVATTAAFLDITNSESLINNDCTKSNSENENDKQVAAEIVPFTNGLDYLDAWFGALGTPIVLEAGAGVSQQAATPGSVYSRLPELLLRTVRTAESEVDLPFEEFASEHGLDLVDRLILLALLRDAHDPRSGVGLSQANLFLAVEATTLSRRIDVMSRLDERGVLRDLKLVECLPGWTRDERRYRLAERFVGPVTHGTGDVMGLPRLSPDPIEAFQALAADVKLLGAAIKMGCLDEYKVWGGAREGEPGWDSTAPWRAALKARLEASVRLESDRIGAEIRRLGLEGGERLAWAVLLADADEEMVGVKVPRLVQMTGRHADPEAAAERILGPDSKLGKAGCIRFNRADGPVLGRIAWLSREARGRVIPWPHGAFFVKPGVDLEALPFTPRVGFDPYGTQKQDRIAAKGVFR
jgi:hypothetical protein